VLKLKINYNIWWSADSNVSSRTSS